MATGTRRERSKKGSDKGSRRAGTGELRKTRQTHDNLGGKPVRTEEGRKQMTRPKGVSNNGTKGQTTCLNRRPEPIRQGTLKSNKGTTQGKGSTITNQTHFKDQNNALSPVRPTTMPKPPINRGGKTTGLTPTSSPDTGQPSSHIKTRRR